MPILAPEPSLFPADLLDQFAQSRLDCQWWAIHTKPRQEKSLARQLAGMNIPFYLPLISKASLIRGRRVESLLPLFAGYLFLFGTEDQRHRALATDRIVATLQAPSRQVLTNDLRSVRALVKSGVPLTVEGRLAPGQRVRVKNGVMMGVEGLILSRRGEDRLLIAIEFLQQGVSVSIQDFQVEPL